MEVGPLDHSKLLSCVNRLELSTRQLVSSQLAGAYHSKFKGVGMQFSEFRQYSYGDDIRHISWTVSARTRDPVVKRFEEERELQMLIVMDVSKEMDFGTQGWTKRQVAAELCGVLSFASVKNNDKVGSILVGRNESLSIRPRKGRPHALRIVRDLLAFEDSTGDGQRVEGILRGLRGAKRIMKHKGILLIASDFRFDLESPSWVRLLAELKNVSQRNDVIAIRVSDPRERRIDNQGLIQFSDIEGSRVWHLDSGNPGFAQKWNDYWSQQRETVEAELRKINVDLVDFDTDGSHLDGLVKFFRERA